VGKQRLGLSFGHGLNGRYPSGQAPETPRWYGQMPFPKIIVGSDIVQLPDDTIIASEIGKSLLIIRPLIMRVYYVSDTKETIRITP
jgi:hypothetical protein